MGRMKVSPRGVLEICEHEGIVPAPYRDSVGVWTWGVGHTAAAGGPDPEQMARAMPGSEAALSDAIEQAVMQLDVDLDAYERDVNAAVRVPLKQHEFDALVSFHYNTGGIHRAKLTKMLNAGSPDAAQHFMGWLKPPEIRGRRTAEMNLFKTGDYDANGSAIPVWGTNGSGRLTKPIRTVSGDWVLSIMGRDPVPPTPREVPPEVRKVVEDAAKPEAKSTINWTAILGFLASGGAWFQAADTETKIALGVLMLAFLWIFKERIRKAKIGKIAKSALDGLQ